MAAFLGRPESSCSVLIEGAQFCQMTTLALTQKACF